MKAVILAGGVGSRLSEETSNRPKPLVEIGGRPIIWHVMQIYAHHGVKDFIVCAGYKSALLKEYFIDLRLHQSDVTVDIAEGSVTYRNAPDLDWRVTIVDTGLDTMTGGRIKRIAHYLDPAEPFFLTYGDGVGDVDITAGLAFHKRLGLKATMTVVAPPSRFGAVRIAEEKIAKFVEKPEGSEGRINGGFFVCEPSVIELIGGDDVKWENAPLETLARTGQLAAFEHSGFWQPMDTLRDKQILEDLWARGSAPWRVWR